MSNNKKQDWISSKLYFNKKEKIMKIKKIICIRFGKRRSFVVTKRTQIHRDKNKKEKTKYSTEKTNNFLTIL